MRTLIKAEKGVLASIATYLINHATAFRFEQRVGIVVYLPLVDAKYFLLNVGFQITDFEMKEVAK